MTIFSTVILGLILGIIFGTALEKSRVFEPGIVLEQFFLRKFIMLKVFLSAIITGLIIFAVFFTLGSDRLSWKVTHLVGDIVGGFLLGLGVTIAGACPGTVFAQIGAGYKDAFATIFGGIVGAFTFIKFKRPIIQALHGYPAKALTLEKVLGLPFWLVALILVLIFIAILYALEKWHGWRSEVGKSANGVD